MWYRVTNPEAFTFPPLVSLLTNGIEKTQVGDAKAILKELQANITNPALGLFVGADIADHLTAVFIVLLPTSHLYLAPQVYLIYSEGKAETMSEVFKAGLDFIKSNGYNTMHGMNRTGEPDAAFARRFKLKHKVIGSVVEYRI